MFLSVVEDRACTCAMTLPRADDGGAVVISNLNETGGILGVDYLHAVSCRNVLPFTNKFGIGNGTDGIHV